MSSLDPSIIRFYSFNGRTCVPLVEFLPMKRYSTCCLLGRIIGPHLLQVYSLLDGNGIARQCERQRERVFAACRSEWPHFCALFSTPVPDPPFPPAVVFPPRRRCGLQLLAMCCPMLWPRPDPVASPETISKICKQMGYTSKSFIYGDANWTSIDMTWKNTYSRLDSNILKMVGWLTL